MGSKQSVTMHNAGATYLNCATRDALFIDGNTRRRHDPLQWESSCWVYTKTLLDDSHQIWQVLDTVPFIRPIQVQTGRDLCSELVNENLAVSWAFQELVEDRAKTDCGGI